ncbi:MAG: hypothetical protein WAO15_16360 [Mycobacterium sp.]
MAPNGSRDDFHNQATQHANYGVGGYPPSGERPPTVAPDPPDRFERPESVDPLDQETEPTPWYRKPVLLIGWLLFVLILIALIIYGISELIHGDQGTSHTPKTTTTSTTTTTTTPPPTTTTPSTSSSAVEPPPQQPTQQPTHQPTQQQPTHRHHLPTLPPVITIPQVPTVITVPPELR